ncbi:MAG: tRNA threonylcarbamoyladenosine dehydratase [Lachnospiraceae bacterium]|nr:tRNA threonylcarbamoyladenosine dehydratase [Lachnospiraceae bacterium]
MNQFSRTELLLGPDGMERLKNARVAVFGIGGVGGYVVEALARSGVGTLDLIDKDEVCLTNLNRQIIATHSTIGAHKVDVAKKRVLDINPDAVVNTHKTFFLPETASDFNFYAYDYVVDAIDTVAGKIQLVMEADRAHTPIISCMGAGNKMDPTAFRVADIYQTSVCPLAKVMRRELRRRGIERLKVVYSEEMPAEPAVKAELSDTAVEAHGDLAKESDTCVRKKRIPGSNAFVPPVAGLILAGEVIRDLALYPAAN